jgi:hypothetical protein
MRRTTTLRGAALLLCLLGAPGCAHGWGANAHKLVTGKAVESLPPEMRGFFEANRSVLTQRVTEPLEWLKKNPGEARNQYIYLDKYGRFPFGGVPRDYNAARTKLGRRALEANGLLPWQIGVFSQKLTEAFRNHDWEAAKGHAAALAFYVALAHDPFQTTENGDGALSGQTGVNRRFGTHLLDRFGLFFFIRPNEAVYINDPTDHAFESCLGAHSWLENILLADRRARAGTADYTDQYYDRFYNQAGAVLVRQLSDAAGDIGSYWLTAWRNAGSPQLPSR